MIKILLFAVLLYFGYRYIQRALLPPPVHSDEPEEEYPDYEIIDDDD